jgi:hypothetical protein
VRAVDEVLEGVEAGRELGVLGSWLERLQVVRVTSFSHLHEQRVQVGAAREGQQLVDLFGRLEAVVEGVNPQRAQLGRIERLASRSGQRRKRRGGWRRARWNWQHCRWSG